MPAPAVRSFNVYESKAGHTAEAAASAVETAGLAVDAGAAQATFDGIQPPDRRVDELRDRLDELLGEATDTLAALRIAARRGELAELPELAAPLTKVAEELHAFAEAHG